MDILPFQEGPGAKAGLPLGASKFWTAKDAGSNEVPLDEQERWFVLLW